MLHLYHHRIYNCPHYCISHLYIEGRKVCDIVEDTDRGLDQSMALVDIMRLKVPHLTAIPTGTYQLSMNVLSPKFSQLPYYKMFCGGYMPRLLDVPGFKGILIHPGNSALSTDGCIIPGLNTIKGRVCDSRKTWESLMRHYLLPAKKAGENILYTIKRKNSPPKLQNI